MTMTPKERIVVDDSDPFGRLDVTREPAPLLALMPVFVPLGPLRGEWEAAREVEAEYIAPGRRAA